MWEPLVPLSLSQPDPGQVLPTRFWIQNIDKLTTEGQSEDLISFRIDPVRDLYLDPGPVTVLHPPQAHQAQGVGRGKTAVVPGAVHLNPQRSESGVSDIFEMGLNKINKDGEWQYHHEDLVSLPDLQQVPQPMQDQPSP